MSMWRARWLLAFAIVALLVGACSSDSDGASESDEAATSGDVDASASSSASSVASDEDTDPEAEPEPEPEETAPPEPEPEDAVLEAEPELEPEFRTIDHLFGTTDVPFKPEHVVVLRTHMALHLLAVGIPPAGFPTEAELADLADLDTDEAEASLLQLNAQIGGLLLPDSEINLEAIAALEPDLVIIDERLGQEAYELLSGIAATVVTEWPDNGSWKRNFEQTVAAAGADEDAVAAVRARYDDLLAQVPTNASDIEITFMRGARGDFRVEVENTFPGSVGAEAGFVIDDGGATEIPADGQIFFSPERLGVVDGDVIVTQDGGFNGIEFLKESALWDELPAVQAGRVVEISPLFYNGGSYLPAINLLAALIDATS